MKALKRIRVIGLVLVLVSLLSISVYGMGGDLVKWLPAWLVNILIGIDATIITAIIVFIFVMGIKECSK